MKQPSKKKTTRKPQRKSHPHIQNNESSTTTPLELQDVVRWVDRLNFIDVPTGNSLRSLSEMHVVINSTINGNLHKESNPTSSQTPPTSNDSSTVDGQSGRTDEGNPMEKSDDSISLVSWNVLAESYCSRRSHPQLPSQYQTIVFNPSKRRQRIETTLDLFHSRLRADVICLQEVDRPEVGTALRQRGYVGVETPRTTRGGGSAGRVDSCAIFAKAERWRIRDDFIIRLDDLASLADANQDDEKRSSSNEDREPTPHTESSTFEKWDNRGVSSTNVQGIQQAFLRRNMAILVRLQHVNTQRTIVIANAHLYWHPGYEYVKLCQAHYILKRARAFLLYPDEPFIFCGDLNSRPAGVTYNYLSKGWINAKQIAPWYSNPYSYLEPAFLQDEESEIAPIQQDADNKECGQEDDQHHHQLVDEFSNLNVRDDEVTLPDEAIPSIRYLLDATLNKLCRWLRILGIDTALETEEEEKMRTKTQKEERRMVLFERCRDEKRSLVTTSTRLLQRKDCPSSAYCISPTFLPNMEVPFVHLLLTHGVVLEPSKFLSRCVVCNGNIVELANRTEAVAILRNYEAPEDLIHDAGLDVYRCNGCGQGYWWCDRPTSSASRVKEAATRLFELCVRAGVPIAPHREDWGIVTQVPFEQWRKEGWDYSTSGSELLRQKLCVIDWLKSERLACPFLLSSAYASNGSESLPFTNVTASFVNTLDYIFFDTKNLSVVQRLYVPRSFSELNSMRLRKNGHLLPSNIWPSDHLAIGARIRFRNDEGAVSFLADDDTEEYYCQDLGTPLTETSHPHPPLVAVHGNRCDCGCVPPILSLMEMAELRRKAKEKMKPKNV